MKVVGITAVSWGAGLLMGLFMGSFDSTTSFGIDVRRSSWSQLRQHYFGHGRYLKRHALHFSRFGLYIGLIESALEIIIGKQNFMSMGFAGGMAAWLQNIRAPFLG